MAYTDQQQEAIDLTDQNLQIIACAGSGKTQVVAERVINILKKHSDQGITAENIVAFTFTERAAAELKDRINRLHQKEFGNVEGLAGMYVGTIHGFCLDLLQRYLFEYLKFDVLDDIKQRLLIDRNSTKSGLSSLGLQRWVESGLYVAILGVLRGADVNQNRLKGHPSVNALAMYQELLNNHRYVDYDEILVRAVVELMSSRELQDLIRTRVKYLTVDEYQDVNPIQEALIRQLYELGANLCVVGDDDQNIYQWRGSDVSHIITFCDRYPKVAQVPLQINFRSTPAIVQIARHAVEANSTRLPKAMVSGGLRDFERGDILCLTFKDPEEEAEWIGDKILAMRGRPYREPSGTTRGLSWSDCAVLLRSVKRCAAPLVEAFRRKGIPHIVTGMTGLFDTLEVRAAAGIFTYVTHQISDSELRNLWLGASLGLSRLQVDRGIQLLTDRRTFDSGKRFSAYNLQRTYLDFLEAIALREDQVPQGRGEVVYYNLGKFSQVISDYEEIHFKSSPEAKYPSFVLFLEHQAPDYYPEGGQDVVYASPDAVKIMTVHQAKGMEYPVVFLPYLQKNRFPARKQHNRVWDHVPRDAVRNADRYDSKEEDERRLFYVAVTRSEKFLFCSWAPVQSNQLYRKASPFFLELTTQSPVLTRDPGLRPVEHITPQPRQPMVNVELSFSDLKYYFECPYQFKLRFLYGFNPPIHEALGYGRSLHNALAEIHRRALKGEVLTERDVPGLVNQHMHVRFAYDALEESLKKAGTISLKNYLNEHGKHLDHLMHAEEVVELTLENGVLVHGRIDLIRRTDINEVSVVDFKSQERAQAEDITRLQLHVYALGYEQKFGKRADLIEVHNLDDGGSKRELIDDALTGETISRVHEAGTKLRENNLSRLPMWCSSCGQCDLAGICRSNV